MTDREKMLTAEATRETYSSYELRMADGRIVCSGGAAICVANESRLAEQFGELTVVQTRAPASFDRDPDREDI